jgi:myo-inositol-1(or 4)-monophosphatase
LQASETTDLDLLLNSLKEAGKIAMGFFGQSPKIKVKPDGTLVTEADYAADTFLKTTITAARPDDGWLSEETPDSPVRLTKKRLWIADPIDGTRAFSDVTRFWGIGLALVEEGAPILSGIYCPVDNVLYHAIKNGGAFRNGVRLTSPESHGHAILPKLAKFPVEQAGLAAQVGSSWPMLVRFALIAEGLAPAAISIGYKQDWDLAAGVLLVTETGGKVSTQAGEPLLFNQQQHAQPGLVASQHQWHDRLLVAVRNI